MKAFLSKRAARSAERIHERWRSATINQTVFAEELLDAVERLEAGTAIGAAFPTDKRPDLQRLLLPRSRCHIYFERDELEQVIRILEVWDGRRERGPKL